MKFLCVDCDTQMVSVDHAAPDDGTLALVYRCPDCARQIAMLANPMETQMVKGLCVDVGGRTRPEEPFEAVSSQLKSAEGRATPSADVAGTPSWSEEAEARLGRVPGFVRGMVRQLYSEWAQERGVGEITLEVMDRARDDLGIEEG